LFRRVVLHQIIVLDEEDQLAIACRRQLAGQGLLAVRVIAVVAGQVDPEGRALARLAVYGDVATRLLDEAVNHGETEPGAAFILPRGEEGFEDALEQLWRYALAGITDGEHDVLARRQIQMLAGLIAFQTDVGRLDGEPASGRHGVTCVYRQVQERALRLGGIDQGLPQLVRLD